MTIPRSTIFRATLPMCAAAAHIGKVPRHAGSDEALPDDAPIRVSALILVGTEHRQKRPDLARGAMQLPGVLEVLEPTPNFLGDPH